MPPKKATKLAKEKPPADPVIDPTAIPPALPPSVEEAYRRKCVQLKQRTNEVEEENDATRIRLARIRRQIEKMRVERSFLLEQLTRRTSANVEDSEGSPSPPPTPKDKPLRTKRGHRKPSMMAELEASAQKSAASPLVGQHLGTMSPSSEAFSHSQAATAGAAGHVTNGVSKAPKEPASAFELYVEEARPTLLKKREDNEGEEEQTVDEELEQTWKDLPDAEREPFQTKRDELVADYEKKKAEHEDAMAEEAEEAEETKIASPEKPAEEKTPDEPKEGAKDEAKESTQEDTQEETKEDAKAEAKEDAKEDEEMKDDEKTQPESSAAEASAAAAETQDEDVEMADNDSEAPAEGKAKQDDKAED